MPGATVRGGALWLARAIVIGGTALALLIFAAAIPGRFMQLQSDYTGDLGLSFHRASNGAVILTPIPGGPADIAGIRAGDTLVAVAGKSVRSDRRTDPIPSGEVNSAITLTMRTPNGARRTYNLHFEGAAVAALGHFHFSAASIATYDVTVDIISIVIVLGICLALLRRRRDDWTAMLMSLAILMLLVSTSGSVFLLSDTQDGLHPLIDTWFALNLPIFSCLLYVFPDGRFVPGWTRYVVAVLVVWALVALAMPGLYPWFMPAPLYFTLILAWPATGALAQVYRYAHVSGTVARQQTKWVVFGVIAAVAGLGLGISHLAFADSAFNLADDAVFDLMLYPTARALELLLPISILIAVLRYRLWDIDTLINRALVYGALTLCVVGIYSVVVGAVGLAVRGQVDPLVAVIATGVVAVLFHPLRQMLQRSVNRMLYGRRDEPYSVLAQLDQRLESILTPEAVLPTVVATVAAALRLPYAAITLVPQSASAAPATIEASVGHPTRETISIPLVYGSQPVGEMQLAPRAPGESFGTADRRLLSDLARHAGVAAHAVQLARELRDANQDLQHSRQAIIMAREEERRRLRRDLHDGLGASLTGLVFSMDAAANLLSAQPDTVFRLLAEMKEQTQVAIADIRRLVYGLRPPVLDELGLVAALEDYIAQHDLLGVRVTIFASDDIPPLPAAVELAAYRIALEALTNALRHAHASICAIRLTVTALTLELEVEDDGIGVGRDCRPGVGMAAMRERAAELASTLEIRDVEPGGTIVRVVFLLSTDRDSAVPVWELR